MPFRTFRKPSAERVGASKARVIDEISSIAFAEPSEAISVAEKLNALALLSKVLGLQVSRQEISGPNGGPVSLDIDASSARARIECRLGERLTCVPRAKKIQADPAGTADPMPEASTPPMAQG